MKLPTQMFTWCSSCKGSFIKFLQAIKGKKRRITSVTYIHQSLSPSWEIPTKFASLLPQWGEPEKKMLLRVSEDTDVKNNINDTWTDNDQKSHN